MYIFYSVVSRTDSSEFVHELSSHPLALNNCSLRLVFSYLGHTRTRASIRVSKSVGDPLVTSRLVIAYSPYMRDTYSLSFFQKIVLSLPC